MQNWKTTLGHVFQSVGGGMTKNYRTFLHYVLLAVLMDRGHGGQGRLSGYMLRRAKQKQLDPFSMISNPFFSSSAPDEVLYAAKPARRYQRQKQHASFRFSSLQAEASATAINCELDDRQCGCLNGFL